MSSSSKKNDDGYAAAKAAAEVKEEKEEDYLLPAVTLADVQNAFPKESDEEKAVMEHIEREIIGTEDGTGIERGGDDNDVEAQRLQPPDENLEHEIKSIPLSSTTSYLSPEFVDSMKEEQQQQQTRGESELAAAAAPGGVKKTRLKSNFFQVLTKHKSTRDHRRKSKITIGQDLFELTNMLDVIGEVEDDDTTVGNQKKSSGQTAEPGGVDSDLDDGSLTETDDNEFEPLMTDPPRSETQADKFGANAAKMFSNIKREVKKNARKANDRMSSAVHMDGQKDKEKEEDGDDDHKQRLQTLQEVHDIIKENRKDTWLYFKWLLLWLILPCLLVATILFYAAGNPDGSGKIDKDSENPFLYASYSWMFIFFGIRQVLTFAGAVGLQFLLISFFTQSGVRLYVFGPMTRLFIIQAKGAPLIMILWGILDLILLFGSGRFSNHWLYYQPWIKMMNADNNSGNFPNNQRYKSAVIFMVCAGAAIAVKRFFVGLRFSKNSYNRYADRLSDILRQVVEITKVARLAQMQKEYKPNAGTMNDMVQAEWWLQRHAYELRGDEDLSGFGSSEADLDTDTVSFKGSAEQSSENHPEKTPNISNVQRSTVGSPLEMERNVSTDRANNLLQPSLSGDSFDGRDLRAPAPRSSVTRPTVETHPVGGGISADSNDETPDASSHSSTPSFHRISLNLGLDSRQSISSAQQIKIDELLGDWEELEGVDSRVEEPSLSAIVQFGSSLRCLESDYAFSRCFGHTRNRYSVVDCSQRVYNDLLKLQKKLKKAIPNSDNPKMLKFHTLCLLCIPHSSGTGSDSDSRHSTPRHGTSNDVQEIDQSKVKALMSVFRPTRQGDISLVDFCKSVDVVYKEIRMLRASITNEGNMNSGAEKLINSIFYFILICVGLAAIGIDPVVLFGALTSFIISFSFCVSGASSDYIRGLLFILVQRPYDIGDRVAFASPSFIASGTFSPQWIIKDVGLYHTTFVFGASQEYATISNGTLATLRVINAARSSCACQYFNLKFGIKVEVETIKEFERRLMAFIKDRPRQWLKPICFRISGIKADLGYIEYIVGMQHRESWQQVGAVLTSTGELQQFCFEQTSELGMTFQSPPLPIEFQVGGSNGMTSENAFDGEAPAAAAFAQSASESLNAILNSQSSSVPPGSSLPQPRT
eukprot:CAMPEP_0113505976 /NCGR_PEP_ID=MMETSP0014_2-20120614/35636_1 /TAXON_ID=2857 /ORGANISM="Nitzschia sp." /LENGTH=1154 /DNA_ID=CAMNT_0000401389 /DNA_START=267 /DNA_END=3731 /DNA_ORIENTATION=- /assembly_acc=CAM_ASM_000159